MFSVESAGIALGLALALGIFAFKTAVGEYYFFSLTASGRKRMLFLAVTWGMYMILFGAVFAILEKFDLFRFAGDSMRFLETGVLLHLILCAGLLAWGIRLLCRRETDCPDRMDSAGWLLLAVPCPVCASAVFLVCAFSRMLFPESGLRLWLGVPLFFLLANAVFLLGLWGAGKLFSLHPLHFTGRMMVFIALYFFLILLIAPRFQDSGKLYSAALSSGNVSVGMGTIVVSLLLAAAAATGFLRATFQRK